MASVSIRSGGQTGVDRAALDFAVAQGLIYGGWCPHGGWAEDFPIAPGLSAKYPRLTETPSSLPQQRTAWNVRDSHATMLIVRGEALDRTPGTSFAKLMAEIVFLRPCLVVDVGSPTAVDDASNWLAALAASFGTSDLWLHVGGPRESEAPGIYSTATAFLTELLGGGAR